jgi:hypothetical protein
MHKEQMDLVCRDRRMLRLHLRALSELLHLACNQVQGEEAIFHLAMDIREVKAAARIRMAMVIKASYPSAKITLHTLIEVPGPAAVEEVLVDQIEAEEAPRKLIKPEIPVESFRLKATMRCRLQQP